MNNEKIKYNQIIDEAYENYLKNGQQEADRNRENQTFLPMPKQMFINKIKTNDEFSEKWGLKIEERELNDDELNIFNLFKQKPTKLITVTYNDTKTEIYE